ncbi:MAG: NAD(P)/FAD-dependent oxidoreductase [Gammaproteobacteria bacterium]|nr:NAD(P)/FAD-dependent oxidoreductase [Gammaproteobacteria bacterium]
MSGPGHQSQKNAVIGRGAQDEIAPWSPTPGRSRDVDIVVVGAGIAGLAATRSLRQRGRSVRLLEASARIGGRVVTDTETFGLPFDRGAHWLHNRAANPLVAWGREQGFDIYPVEGHEILYVGDRVASSAETNAFERAYRAAIRAIGKAGKRGHDVCPAEVVADAGEWSATVHQAIGPFEMAKDFDRFSCQDWWEQEDGDDAICRQGYGSLVARLAQGVEVELDTPVNRIDWSGDGVRVHSQRGSIRAACCIVTVSTGVLAANGIRFDPALPARQQEAFNRVSMGIYNHLALQFSQNFFGIGADGYLTYQIPNGPAKSPAGMGMLVNQGGSNLSFGDVGGEFARELESEGVDGGIHFALGELRKIFGSDVDRYFIRGDATRWGSDPHYHGAYASAEPGAWHQRRVLRKPVADRIYFAGEACDRYEWSTVHGAYRSGRKTAKRVHKCLTPARD